MTEVSLRACFALLFALTMFGPARAATQIGDWGHFIGYAPTTCFNNPEGEAFTVRVHVMQWGTRAWLRKHTTLRFVGPGGEIIADGAHELRDSVVTLSVPAGAAGVYRLHTTDYVWVSSTLDQSVAWTGIRGTHLMDDEPVADPATGKKRKREFYEKRGQLVFQAAVPRRWWFWVPPDVTEFTCSVMRADRCMSQREDWGYFIISPRGQRIRALWGQPAHTPRTEYRQLQTVKIEVEPGAAGRFWCLEVSLGDSHQYSNINFSMEGVPPYLARSPEEWFDPGTGTAPQIPLYDDTPFMQSAKTDMRKERWPNLQHFSPCPSLGDPDGVEVLGDAVFALWNPENRELGFRVGTYLPRSGFKEPSRARVQVTRKRKVLLDEEMEMHHLHGDDGDPTHTLKKAKGVCRVSVTGAERFMSFTYPATPLVLVGKPQEDGFNRFSFTACAPRNWYFFVPKGTRTFEVRVKATIATDVLKMEICAPDHVVDLVYGKEAHRVITVPAGRDNKMWYFRPSVGSASRMKTEKGPDYRYQDLPLTLDIKGVPGYLAPTWEQWFSPEKPGERQ